MPRIRVRDFLYSEAAQAPAFGAPSSESQKMSKPSSRFASPPAELPHGCLWTDRGPEFAARHVRTHMRIADVTEERVLAAVQKWSLPSSAHPDPQRTAVSEFRRESILSREQASPVDDA